jgi:hypothetical protein
MRSSRLSILAILTLVATFFSPMSPVANAVGTVTKTISVKKSDGSNYPGALVSLLSWDQETQLNMFTDPVAANASGVVTLQVDAETAYESIVIQPPLNDLSHAAFNDWGSLVTGENEAITKTLSAANAAVKVVRPNGTPIPVGTWLGYTSPQDAPGDLSTTPLLRTGSVGINLSAGLPSSGCYKFIVYGRQSTGDFDREYGIKLVNGTTPTIYQDTTCAVALTPTQENGVSVFTIETAAPNISGALVSATGAPLTLPISTISSIQFFEADSDGNFSGVNGQGDATTLASNGSFNSKIQTKTVKTKLFPIVRISG